MKKRRMSWFMIGLIGCLAVIIGAYLWAIPGIDSLTAYRSPLAETPPTPGAALGEPLTRRVVVVLIDALRVDTAADPDTMPILDELRQQGASATVHSRPPSFSAPSWTTILTGAWPDLNDGQPMNPGDSAARAFTQDDVFAAADRAGLNAAVSGYIWFHGMLAGSGVDAEFVTPREDHAADRAVVDAALPWLESGAYQFVLIHLDQVDYAGHYEGGPGDPDWAAAAARTDALLGEIAATLDLEQDTILVLSDHGQIDAGGHGGPEPVTLVQPFVLAGAAVQPGEYVDIRQVDIAPTLAVLLGTNLPASSQGNPLTHMLVLDPDREQAIQEVLDVQQANLLDAYTTAIGEPAPEPTGRTVVEATQRAMAQARAGRMARERVWRNVLAAFLAIFPPYLFFYMRREKRALWAFAGGLVTTALFHLRYAVIDGNTYGFSSTPGQMEFILYIGVTMAAATLAGWLVSMFGLHAFHLAPRQAAGSALGFVWAAIYFAALPALASFAVNGVLVGWTLPEFWTFYIGLISIMQVLFAAAVGLALVGVSAGAAVIIHKQT
jgi:hypothetical protein